MDGAAVCPARHSLPQVDLKLAKENADRPDDESVRKRLWLKIARHVVQEERDIKGCVRGRGTDGLLR